MTGILLTLALSSPFAVAWTPASGPVARYEIHVRKEFPTTYDYKPFTRVAPRAGGIRCVRGHLYRVRVRALDSAGNAGPFSEWSEPIWCRAAPPAGTCDE